MSWAEEPPSLIEGGGKLRNGIFLRSVALYRDRVAFEVFSARPFGPMSSKPFSSRTTSARTTRCCRSRERRSTVGGGLSSYRELRQGGPNFSSASPAGALSSLSSTDHKEHAAGVGPAFGNDA